MSKMIAAAFAALLSLTAAQPVLASDKSDVQAVIRKTMQYANTGDDAKFAAMLAAGGVVIDEFAPFRWDGLAAWANSYGAYNAQNGITAAKTRILRFKHIMIGGDRAYALIDVDYTYKANGIAHLEKGSDLFVLTRTAEGWRILSFAWASSAGIDAGADATAVADAVRAEFAGFNNGTVDFAKLGWNGVLDEFPAYSFNGATTVADWGAGFQKTGQTDTKVTLAAPTHLSVNGNDGYVVFPAVITGKIKGKPLKEHGRFAFNLSKANGLWTTRSWAWFLD